jgi:hypothetical protein
MQTLKIRMFKGTEPTTTVSIPLRFVKLASHLVPAKAQAALREEGIDLAEIVRISEDPAVRGELVVIEDHVKGERTVVSIE